MLGTANRGTRRALAGFVGGVLLLNGIAACGGGRAGASSAHDAPPATITITPTAGASAVRPDLPVVVQATGGALDNVALTAGGQSLDGDYNQQHTQWKSRWALKPGATFSVQASAKNPAGKPVTATGSFSTQHVGHTFSVSQDWIMEGNEGSTYGVGMPIILNFDQPIANKAAVERSLEVTADKPVEGAWHWVGDNQVVYRTKTYWPAHQTVHLTAHLTGVRGAKGLYGVKDFSRTYKIGAAQIAYINLRSDQMRVERDGQVVRKEPVSGGMGGTQEYTTTSGIHLTMEKSPSVWMTSPNRSPGDPGYYHELINYAVRISSLGEYLHQTPGQEYCLGHENCSHGCIRQPASDALWYYDHAQPADVVIVKGTDRNLDWTDGWGFYQQSWSEWLKGSALPSPDAAPNPSGSPSLTSGPSTAPTSGISPSPSVSTSPMTN